MARVLLIGAGPLPMMSPERAGFPELRTEHTLKALLAGGHEVSLALLQPEAQAARVEAVSGVDLSVMRVTAERGDWIGALRAYRVAQAPDVVVSAGPYNAARAAALSVGEEPLWLDVPGDPFAEAQARSAHAGEVDATPHQLAAYAPGLARADAFGCISSAQRFALLGQLGQLGRLTGAPLAHDWVSVVPAAMDFGALPLGAPRPRPQGALTLALTGGYNTWLDTDTLVEGALRAMSAVPGLRLVSTGGAIPGHHSASYEAFVARAKASPYAARFRFHGWVPHAALPGCLAEAHLGLSLDRPGVEAELGTRTRVLFFAHQGLEVMGTARSALTMRLAAAGLMHEVPMGDPAALAAALIQRAAEGCDGSRAAALQAHLVEHHSLSQAFAPLLAWLAAPARVRPASSPSAALSARVAELERDLAEVHRSPTWRAAGAAERAFKRLPRRVIACFKGKD